MLHYPPGARVEIRDEEWLIRKSDASSDGGWLLTCDGISELVRGRTGLFLTKLEDDIKILDPKLTTLVRDTSSHFNSSMLYLEAQLRRSTPNDVSIRLGHKAVMNLASYQLDPALQALKQPRQRILIADAVGLGKTLEAGILTTELIQRGRGKRILVVALKSMLTQFQKEFWSRFTIPLVRLDSAGLQRVQSSLPSNYNPFNYYDRTIISIDTLKNNQGYRNYLKSAWWDIIIIDECHNVAARAGDGGISRRAMLAKMLAERSDTLILLSATPHDGSARSFASLMNLLDPTAISDPEDYTPEDFSAKGLVCRRFKKDIKDELQGVFPERELDEKRFPASEAEETAYEALLAIPFTLNGEHKSGKFHELQRIALQKAMFSSPAAAAQSAKSRMGVLQKDRSPNADERAELAALEAFAAALEKIHADDFTKYVSLLNLLKDRKYRWSGQDTSDRLVIFSERIETLRWLKAALCRDMSLPEDAVVTLHGEGMSDVEQQDIVDRFGRTEDRMRVLLCSDLASEGLNLHYLSHRLIHFDLPWSLMVYQQRNGRIDRFGQTKTPIITYLLAEVQNSRIKGDLRILEVLRNKDDQAYKNLGDPSAFLRVIDPVKEAVSVAAAMARGDTADDFDKKLEANRKSTSARVDDADEDDGNWLEKHFMAAEVPARKKSTEFIRNQASLFQISERSADYEFAKTALKELHRVKAIGAPSFDDANETLSLTAPSDLQDRLKVQLPVEVRDSADRYNLCSVARRMGLAIEEARQATSEENSWPELHYLWRQHPIMEWLTDRVLAQFGRHTAPVIRSDKLAQGERAFVLTGLIPNRKGQPLVIDWQVSVHRDGQWVLEGFESFARRTELKANALINSGQDFDFRELQNDLPDAVQAMRQHMVVRQKTFSEEMNDRLRQTLEELKALQGRQMQQLELRLSENKQAEQFKRTRREERTREISKVFDNYRDWVRDTMTTEPHPFIQVVAAVTR